MENTIVIFGASGDLTSRKLIPALYELKRKGRLPDGARIVGTSRTEFSHAAWRETLAQSTAEFVGQRFDRKVWDELAPSIFYQPGDMDSPESFPKLGDFLAELEAGRATTRVYYLSTAPRFYEAAARGLGAAGMAAETDGPRRIVIEKPFGTDLDSARALNRVVHETCAEHQVYRIDHYLGKETVSNILALRFANTIFEPVWNRNYIDHVQITMAEDEGVGHRAGYYDGAGVLRDIFQNHLLQLLALTAMEPPSALNARTLRDEKVKVLQAVRPLSPADLVQGQYEGYRREPHVRPTSGTPTYAALRLYVDNWRWQGVPFYLRSGKALAAKTTEISLEFRRVPHLLFLSSPDPQPNRLCLFIQPNEGVVLSFGAKEPGAGMRARPVQMVFRYEGFYGARALPEAYERLLLDAIQGDAGLFARSDEIELAWALMEPLLDVGAALPYPPGSQGPAAADAFMARDGRQWLDMTRLPGAPAAPLG